MNPNPTRCPICDGLLPGVPDDGVHPFCFCDRPTKTAPPRREPIRVPICSHCRSLMFPLFGSASPLADSRGVVWVCTNHSCSNPPDNFPTWITIRP
jgi:hypothetical protein